MSEVRLLVLVSRPVATTSYRTVPYSTRMHSTGTRQDDQPGTSNETGGGVLGMEGAAIVPILVVICCCCCCCCCCSCSRYSLGKSRVFHHVLHDKRAEQHLLQRWKKRPAETAPAAAAATTTTIITTTPTMTKTKPTAPALSCARVCVCVCVWFFSPPPPPSVVHKALHAVSNDLQPPLPISNADTQAFTHRNSGPLSVPMKEPRPNGSGRPKGLLLFRASFESSSSLLPELMSVCFVSKTTA